MPEFQSFWSQTDRKRLSDHITSEVEKLAPGNGFVCFVRPESSFAGDTSLVHSKGQERGGSAWLRESMAGQPFGYNELIKTAIHELAHRLAYQADPYHDDDVDPAFKDIEATLVRLARRLDIWPKPAVPAEVSDIRGLNVGASR